MRAATVLGLLALAALIVLASTGASLMPHPGETNLMRTIAEGVMTNLRRLRFVHQGAAWTMALCASAAYLNHRRSRWLAVAAGAAIVAHVTGPLVFLLVPIKWVHIAVLPAVFVAALGIALVLGRKA